MVNFRLSSVLLHGFQHARGGYRSKPRSDNRRGRQQVRRLAFDFHGRLRTCFRLARRQAAMTMKYETTIHRKLEKLLSCELYMNRMDAAAQQHGIAGHEVYSAMTRMNVQLEPKIMADFAIYEPKTFQCLCIAAKQYITDTEMERQ
ncbi:hypothetical protein ACOME3_002722 [Neoechinorhynchus agilis]